MGSETATTIPTVTLNSGNLMPVLGMGTTEFPIVPEKMKAAILEAIKIGHRQFDTAMSYGSERSVGEAIAEAVRLGVIKSRDEVFVTSKLWCTDAHPDLVLPALKNSLKNLQMEYVDLYLIHWPICVKPVGFSFPIKREDVVPLDLKGVWKAMEECKKLGLAKDIGVSNFTTKKLDELLEFTTIPPAVNQVEMNPSWRQHKMKEYCAKKGIQIAAYSSLGGQGRLGPNIVLTSDVLKEIANAKGKTVAQISLRWLYEQGACFVVKSFNSERLMQNLEIFDWKLTEEELEKISTLKQEKRVSAESILAKDGSFVSVKYEDIDIVEA